MTELILQKDGAPQPLEPLIYDLGSPGRVGITLPAPDVPLADLPADLLRDSLDLSLLHISEPTRPY